MDKAATRDGYGKALEKIGENPNVVVLDAGMSDSTRTNKFEAKWPDRFFNMGISEMDMIATAAGLAKSGKIAFASSFSTFVQGRTQDQQLVSVCYSAANVKIVVTHCGLAVGEDGPTAQAQNDVGMARAMPTMIVIEPADEVEAQRVIEYLVTHEGPAFVRMGRLEVNTYHDDTYQFELGKASILKEGTDATIIASGALVQESMAAAELLAAEGIKTSVINMSSIKPIDEDAIKKAAKTGIIVAAQDHNIFGGLHDAVADVIARNNLNVKFDRVGIQNKFAESDKPAVLYEKYGLDAKAIAVKVKNLL